MLKRISSHVLVILGTTLGLLLAAAARGDALRLGGTDLDLSGFLASETRFFLSGPRYDGQANGSQPSLLLQPELRRSSEDGRHRLSVVSYLRLDGRDGERSHFDLREAYWLWLGDSWEVLAGIDKVFWGVTESRHLVDVVNQSDLVEDLDEEDKLGQPMVSVTTRRAWGTLDFFVLPFFRERTFPGREGRLRPPLPVAADAVYESAAGDRHVDFALRYSHYFGDWDVGASYFYGTGREPRLVTEGSELVAHYDLIHQFGVDVQFTRNAWLWKLETIVREGQGDTFAAWVAGFEYTFFQVGGAAADLGLLVEHLYDGRDPRTAPATLYDDDVFVGARLALNDSQDTSTLIGAIVDRDERSTAFFVEAGRRIGRSFKVEIEGRFFVDAADDPVLAPVADDDLVTLRLSRHF